MSWNVAGKHLPLIIGTHLPQQWLDWIDTKQLFVGLWIVHGFRIRVVDICRFHREILQQCWPDFGIHSIWQCYLALTFCSRFELQ